MRLHKVLKFYYLKIRYNFGATTTTTHVDSLVDKLENQYRQDLIEIHHISAYSPANFT